MDNALIREYVSISNRPVNSIYCIYELDVEALCSFHGTIQVSHCTGVRHPKTLF